MNGYSAKFIKSPPYGSFKTLKQYSPLINSLKDHFNKIESLYNSSKLDPFNLSLYEMLGVFSVFVILQNNLNNKDVRFGFQEGKQGFTELDDGFVYIDRFAYALEQTSAFVQNKNSKKFYGLDLEKGVKKALSHKIDKEVSPFNRNLLLFIDGWLIDKDLLIPQVDCQSKNDRFKSYWLLSVDDDKELSIGVEHYCPDKDKVSFGKWILNPSPDFSRTGIYKVTESI
ncbi:hypothetical protein GF362_00910 [Candidatus Dojkabacteria bacterium]|nr:hypothetical protein [Candidatus Dojkabacteria bacterium]